jgi:hypothetical protein
LARQIGQINSGVFSADLLNSTHFGKMSPLTRFSHYSTIISTKNQAFIFTSQTFIWDWELNLGCKELGI